MKKTVSFLASLATGIALLGGGVARAEKSFDFFGAGWGHGIGMGQYGAYGLARDGWSAARIVRHYYRGTGVNDRNPPAGTFRIGLLQSRHAINLSAVRGSFTLVLASGRELETVQEGQDRKVVIGRGRYGIRTPDGTVVARGGGAGDHLLLRRGRGAIVRIAEWGHPLARGRAEFNIVSDDRAHLVAILRPEQYLYGIAEVPSSWPRAALQAQAIAARTYAYKKVAAFSDQRRPGCNCGLYASTLDQLYVGWDKEAGDQGDRWVAAVDASREQVALYDDDFIYTYYSSSTGGFSENVENVWSGAAPAPYLKGVCDPGDYVTSNPNRTWSLTMGGNEIGNRVQGATGVNVGSVTAFTDTTRGVSGRVEKVTVVGTRGSVRMDGWDLRGALGLKDTRFTINRNRNVTGAIRAQYDRLMCRPGLATGSRKAVDGGRFQSFERGRLYHHAGRDVVVWLRGPVLDKYLGLGGHGSFLGLPYRLASIQNGAGRLGRFDGGVIYWKAGPGAHEVHGPVLDEYDGLGAHASDLGYPVSDVERLDSDALRSRFEGGTITCPSGGGCNVRYD